MTVDKMIAGKDAAVLFHDQYIAAGFTEPADRAFLSGKNQCCFGKQLDIHPAQIIPDPLPENRFQKTSVGFR